MSSLVSFTISHLIILIRGVTEVYTVIYIHVTLFVIVDLMPIVYMTYCHIKMFKQIMRISDTYENDMVAYDN